MKATLQTLWNKVVENKVTVIKISGIVLGALIGATVSSVIAESQETYDLSNEDMMVEDLP